MIATQTHLSESQFLAQRNGRGRWSLADDVSVISLPGNLSLGSETVRTLQTDEGEEDYEFDVRDDIRLKGRRKISRLAIAATIQWRYHCSWSQVWHKWNRGDEIVCPLRFSVAWLWIWARRISWVSTESDTHRICRSLNMARTGLQSISWW